MHDPKLIKTVNLNKKQVPVKANTIGPRKSKQKKMK